MFYLGTNNLENELLPYVVERCLYAGLGFEQIMQLSHTLKKELGAKTAGEAEAMVLDYLKKRGHFRE